MSMPIPINNNNSNINNNISHINNNRTNKKIIKY